MPLLFRQSTATQYFKIYRSPNYTLHLLHSLSADADSNDFDLSTLLQGNISRSHLQQIHARVFRVVKHQDNLIATRLIGKYPSHIACRVFHQLQKPNIFPFNAIIRVLAEEGLPFQSFSLFKYLKQLSLLPNDFTFSFLLKSCLRSIDAQCVEQIHTQMLKMGFTGDSFVWVGLLGVYAKGLKDMNSARKMFDEMPNKDMIFCWTSLIAGYAQSGCTDEVLGLFISMINENLIPKDDTLVSVLSICSNLEKPEIEKWVSVLLDLVNNRDTQSLRDSVYTVLIYLNGKRGEIEKSRENFNEIIDKRNVLLWNAMIGAYVHNSCPMDALSLFRLMFEDTNCRPNHVTMVSVLSACAQVGDLELGNCVHEYIQYKGRKCIIASNRILATALIDMYSKCGSLEKAKSVFNQLVSKDAVSFNAMIMGLAVNSQGEEALNLFTKMQQLGIQPNAGTFVSVLCACSHSGLSDKGRQIFIDMTKHFSISPSLEHYACYIDLLARVGLLEEAIEVVSTMPFEPNNFVWGALLGGCLVHSRAELAHYVSAKLVEVDPENSAGYVMMANALAVDHRWGDVSALRGIMRERGVKKQPGQSWISVNGVVHEFLAVSPSHPCIDNIFHTLDQLAKQMKLPIA